MPLSNTACAIPLRANLLRSLPLKNLKEEMEKIRWMTKETKKLLNRFKSMTTVSKHQPPYRICLTDVSSDEFGNVHHFAQAFESSDDERVFAVLVNVKPDVLEPLVGSSPAEVSVPENRHKASNSADAVLGAPIDIDWQPPESWSVMEGSDSRSA